MRMLTVCTLAVLALGLAMQAGLAGELRIAAWNLEHLDDTEGHGCVGRDRGDYDGLARQIVELDADIVAFQEVENAAAARVGDGRELHLFAGVCRLGAALG